MINGGGKKQLRLALTPSGIHLEPPREEVWRGQYPLMSFIKHVHRTGSQNVAYCVGGSKACRGALWTPATLQYILDTTLNRSRIYQGCLTRATWQT